VEQTALYFSPEFDTVHIVNGPRGTEFFKLSCRTDKETIRSIKALAIRHQLSQDRWAPYIAGGLRALESLETLILVVDGETGSDGEGSSMRLNMEDHLVKTRDQLVLQGICKEWKLPAVKVMTPRAFESYL
jgi:hypothetical protein